MATKQANLGALGNFLWRRCGNHDDFVEDGGDTDDVRARKRFIAWLDVWAATYAPLSLPRFSFVRGSLRGFACEPELAL